VVVGQDVAILGNDEPRPGALLKPGLLLEGRKVPEEALESWRHLQPRSFPGRLRPTAGLDVDHTGLDVLGDGGEGLAQVL
jgi:hypothetical protein